MLNAVRDIHTGVMWCDAALGEICKWLLNEKERRHLWLKQNDDTKKCCQALRDFCWWQRWLYMSIFLVLSYNIERHETREADGEKRRGKEFFVYGSQGKTNIKCRLDFSLAAGRLLSLCLPKMPFSSQQHSHVKLSSAKHHRHRQQHHLQPPAPSSSSAATLNSKTDDVARETT